MDEGRAILTRIEPEYEYDLDVLGATNCCLCRKMGSRLRNFGY
jgi:hypothetical protein